MLQDSAAAISLFIALLVAVTFARSRFAAFSVGVVGAVARRHRWRRIRAARHRGNAHLERTNALHVSVDALRVGRTQAHLQALCVSEHRVEYAAAKLLEISMGTPTRRRAHAEQGVEELHRIAFGRQRHVRADVREIQARRAHVDARVLQDARLERLVRLVGVNGARQRADRLWAATASLWTFRAVLRTATWRCPPWWCKSCRRRPPTRRPRPSRVL